MKIVIKFIGYKQISFEVSKITTVIFFIYEFMFRSKILEIK
jgi:hypothetical protein